MEHECDGGVRTVCVVLVEGEGGNYAGRVHCLYEVETVLLSLAVRAGCCRRVVIDFPLGKKIRELLSLEIVYRSSPCSDYGGPRAP